jgi:DNA-binding MarR family transcriptional regulator
MQRAGEQLAGKNRERQEIAVQAEEISRHLARIRRVLRKPLDAEVSKGGLTVPQKAAMLVVVRNPGISIKALSREMSLAHSTVSGIAERLERRGLIECRLDSEDRRIVRIHPSEEVAAFIRSRISLLQQGPLEGALRKASAVERAEIGRALKRLDELLEVV